MRDTCLAYFYFVIHQILVFLRHYMFFQYFLFKKNFDVTCSVWLSFIFLLFLCHHLVHLVLR